MVKPLCGRVAVDRKEESSRGAGKMVRGIIIIFLIVLVLPIYTPIEIFVNVDVDAGCLVSG